MKTGTRQTRNRIAVAMAGILGVWIGWRQPAQTTAEWTPKPGDLVQTSYGGSPVVTVIERVEFVGSRSQTGILIYGLGMPGIDSWWVVPASNTERSGGDR